MVQSLMANRGWREREIYAYIDGARTAEEEAKVMEVATIARELTGAVIVSPVNKGLAQSIISGITEVINRYGSVIVLEDDLVLQPRFLEFMDEAMSVYHRDERIISVCGYGLKIKRPKGYEGDVYLSRRSSSWGWGTWADRWNAVDWSAAAFEQLKTSRKMQHEFNRGGSDMYGMLCDYMERRNNSWAIRFCFHQFLSATYSVHPFRSLVINDGYGVGATNCRQKFSRFKIELDKSLGNMPLSLPTNLEPHSEIERSLLSFHSLPMRVYSRIRKFLNI